MICSSAMIGVFGIAPNSGWNGSRGMEVERPVLDLDEHVVAERAVERHELLVGALDAVGIDGGVVDEGAPHDDAAVRRDRVGEHVGAVGVGALVVLRAGLALAVGLHQEAAEVGDRLVDLGRPCPSTTAATAGSSGSAVGRPPIGPGAAKLADR